MPIPLVPTAKKPYWHFFEKQYPVLITFHSAYLTITNDNSAWQKINFIEM
jgi:hypothetical protein